VTKGGAVAEATALGRFLATGSWYKMGAGEEELGKGVKEGDSMLLKILRGVISLLAGAAGFYASRWGSISGSRAWAASWCRACSGRSWRWLL
jgi:hypothetical protein